MTGGMPGCSATVCLVSVCHGKGPVPINSSLQRFRTTSFHPVHCSKRIIFQHTFPLPRKTRPTSTPPKRTAKTKGQKPESKANNHKKPTPAKEPQPKQIPATPEAKRERQSIWNKERSTRAKALGLCRHCEKPAIQGQTRCERCAEKHRVTRRAYDIKRRAVAKRAKDELTHKAAVPDLPKNAPPHPTNRTSHSPPKVADKSPTFEARQEYERLRQQRPERKEAQRRKAHRKRQRAKELGLCRDCMKPAIPDQTMCEICAEKHRQRRRKNDAGRRAKAKAERGARIQN